MEAEPLRGWDGELAQPGNIDVEAPKAVAIAPKKPSTTTTLAPKKPRTTTTLAPKKPRTTTTLAAIPVLATTTTTTQPLAPTGTNDFPWSGSADAYLTTLFGDDRYGWSEVKVSCINDLINDGYEPTEARVYELFAFYCDPLGYIDTWSQTLTLPTAPGAEACFARVYVEEATTGESRDAAWFIQDRWEPPQPQRDKIIDRLTNECDLTEDDWFAAGMKRERSTSWKEFCVELDAVSYKHRDIRFYDLESGALNDPAVYVQRQQDEIDDYSLLTPPSDLAGDFDAFLTAQQLVLDYIEANGFNEDEFTTLLFDKPLTSADMGIPADIEVAWSRFQNVQYEDCPALRFE